MGSFPSVKDAIRLGIGSAIATTTAVDQDLIVDSQPVPQGKHWIVQHVNFKAIFTTANPSVFVPLTGIFACPLGTPGDVAHNAGFLYSLAVLAAYPIRIDSMNSQSTTFGGTGNVGEIAGVYTKFVLPSGWFLRGAFGGTLGTAGVGIGSTGQLNFSYEQRDNDECDPVPVCVV
jgi:hypothetical protein